MIAAHGASRTGDASTSPALEQSHLPPATALPPSSIGKDISSITYQGHIIQLAKFQAWARALIQEATQLLFEELLFSPPTMLSGLSLDSLTDDMWMPQMDGSFLTNPSNEAGLAAFLVDPIQRLEAQPGGDLLVTYPEVVISSEAELKNIHLREMKKILTWPIAMAYDGSATRFLELLLVIIIVAGGLPPYEEDLLHICVANDGDSRRGIYLQNGNVITATVDDDPNGRRPALRFMPPRVGLVFILYLLNVRPLTSWTGNNFLFADIKQPGCCWSRARYESVLERETLKGLGIRLGVDGLRTVITEISRSMGILNEGGYMR